MRAPFCPVALDTATAVLSRFASDFARLTSWFEPKASFAGRLDCDIAGSLRSCAAPNLNLDLKWGRSCVAVFKVAFQCSGAV